VTPKPAMNSVKPS